MKQKISAYLLAGLSFLVRKILLFDLAIIGVILLSFLIWGPLTVESLSERLVWSGIGIAMVAGIMVFSQTSGGRNFGVPGQFQGSVHGKTMIDFNIEVRQAMETKMGALPRIFLIGAILFGVGALVQVLFG